MFIKFRMLVEGHFNLVLLIGVLLGLFAPGVQHLPNYTALILSACVIFFSCSKIHMEDFHAIEKGSAAFFCVFRFLVLPLILYGGFKVFFPPYAEGALLLSLAPVGVAATAVSGMVGGNGALTLSATAITHLLVPLVIPAIFFLVGGPHITVGAGQMFMALSLTVFVPVIGYFFVARRISFVKEQVQKNTPFMTVLLLAAMGTAIFALQRDFFFQNPELLGTGVMVSAFLYFFYYGVGWEVGFRKGQRVQKTYSICSGVNNIALAAGISALYLSPFTTLFIVFADISWILGVAVFRRLFREDA